MSFKYKKLENEIEDEWNKGDILFKIRVEQNTNINKKLKQIANKIDELNKFYDDLESNYKSKIKIN